MLNFLLLAFFERFASWIMDKKFSFFHGIGFHRSALHPTCRHFKKAKDDQSSVFLSLIDGTEPDKDLKILGCSAKDRWKKP